MFSAVDAMVIQKHKLCVRWEMGYSVLLKTLEQVSWQNPSQPEGKLDHDKVLISCVRS